MLTSLARRRNYVIESRAGKSKIIVKIRSTTQNAGKCKSEVWSFLKRNKFLKHSLTSGFLINIDNKISTDRFKAATDIRIWSSGLVTLLLFQQDKKVFSQLGKQQRKMKIPLIPSGIRLGTNTSHNHFHKCCH